MHKANPVLMLLMVVVVACAPAETVSVRVIDGDTVDAGLDNNIRLTLDDGSGFDTPETFRPGCASEAAIGQAATRRLREILGNARDVDLALGSRSCGFGRYCGALRIDGINVGDTLIREVWRSGRRTTIGAKRVERPPHQFSGLKPN